MYWLLGLISLSLLGLIGMGVFLELRPMSKRRQARRWFKGTVAVNLLTFVGAEL